MAFSRVVYGIFEVTAGSQECCDSRYNGSRQTDIVALMGEIAAFFTDFFSNLVRTGRFTCMCASVVVQSRCMSTTTSAVVCGWSEAS